jgi:nucleotide-binding universal stress UspA family protein
MFTRILVPLDGSPLAECVLPHVLAFSHATGAQVMLLRVLDRTSGSSAGESVDPVEWQIRKAEADTYLRDLAALLQKSGLVITAETLEGKAAESVIEYAHQSKADLIILSSHGQSGISGWNVSSIVQKIILRVKTSVLIIRAYKATADMAEMFQYKKVFVPLDGSQRAEFVLPAVVALARAYNSQVILVQTIHKPEIPRRTPPPQEDLDLVNQIIERNRVEASRYLTEVSDRLDSPATTRLLISDSIVSSLHTQVEQDEADLVILSAHGYGGETRWPYGSVVISFIAYGSTPLLVMQDLPSERIEPTAAEVAARESGGR